MSIRNDSIQQHRALKREANAKKREQAKIDDRISRAFYSRCGGVQIDIMDTTKVFGFGREAIAAGCDDTELADGIQAFVNNIRKN